MQYINSNSVDNGPLGTDGGEIDIDQQLLVQVGVTSYVIACSLDTFGVLTNYHTQTIKCNTTPSLSTALSSFSVRISR